MSQRKFAPLTDSISLENAFAFPSKEPAFPWRVWEKGVFRLRVILSLPPARENSPQEFCMVFSADTDNFKLKEKRAGRNLKHQHTEILGNKTIHYQCKRSYDLRPFNPHRVVPGPFGPKVGNGVENEFPGPSSPGVQKVKKKVKKESKKSQKESKKVEKELKFQLFDSFWALFLTFWTPGPEGPGNSVSNFGPEGPRNSSVGIEGSQHTTIYHCGGAALLNSPESLGIKSHWKESLKEGFELLSRNPQNWETDFLPRLVLTRRRRSTAKNQYW